MALTNSTKPEWVKRLEEKDRTTGTVVSEAAERKAANGTKSSNSGATSGTTNYASTSGSSGGSNKNSQYTGSSNSIKTYNSDQQRIKEQMNANSIAWWSADEEGRRALEQVNKNLAAQLGDSVTYDSASGMWYGRADVTPETPGDMHSWNKDYNEKNEKPTEPDRDPRIDKLLNEILNRDDFSYDAKNDPLYQQYAQMYQREGDRAMKETLAEAAAGAGGMNTYAITAAQQANSYYNSQLNDRIPELYQLAYDMYLADKESKVQDLGILQNMDDTQYNRYRNTMNDWYNDKNFAYGAYQDAVNQGNYLNEYEDSQAWKQKEWDYNDFWQNKQWDYGVEQDNKQWSKQEQEDAYKRIMDWIEAGVTSFSPELIKKAGLTPEEANLLIAAKQAQQNGVYG